MIKNIIFSFLVFGLSATSLQAQATGTASNQAVSCIDIEIEMNSIEKTIELLKINLNKSYEVYHQKQENREETILRLQDRIYFLESAVNDARDIIESYKYTEGPKSVQDKKILSKAREKFFKLNPLLKEKKLLLIRKTYELDKVLTSLEYKSQEIQLKIVKAEDALTQKFEALSLCENR